MTLDPATSRESVAVQPQQPPQNTSTQPESQELSQNENQTKPIVGIIYPPPEHRNIIDKTAMFVARNGPEFEEKVRQNEISNSKFNFFNTTDPYHAYYQHKIKEFREGKALEPVAPQKPTLPSAVQAQQEKLKQQIAAESAVPKEAPPDFEFTADPPSISGLELDIVKLTAQFVARNGRHFLTQLMNREQRNPQFDFLRPQHGMFQYFTKLVEQYTKVLIPPKDLGEMLERQSLSMNPMVDEVKKRAEWRKHVEKQKQKAADEQEKERVAYAQIDWHDFVIVETVDFQQHETLGLPPPVTPATVGARVIHQQRLDEKKRLGIEDEGKDDANNASSQAQRDGAEDEEETGGADMDLEDMEESDDEPLEDEAEDDDAQDVPQSSTAQPAIQPLPTGGEDLLIRKDYDPKMRGGTSGIAAQVPKYFVNELTGEKIPLDEVNKHVKYNLLDPRWLEEKERQQREKQQQEEVFAIGNQIGDSLKQFSERRTDIFGAGDEETMIGRKLGEEEEDVIKRDERAIWDGHTASVESTTKRIQANITIQDQIDAIHKAKGLSEDSSKEKIGPQLGASSSGGESSSAVPKKPEVNMMKPTGVQPSAVAQIGVRPPVATPLIVPIVPVVQRPPVVPVFNPNPGAASMLGAQAALLRPTVAGLAMQQQNLAVAALAAQQQAGLVAAAQANAEKNAQAQAAAAAAAGTLTQAMTKQGSGSSHVGQSSSGDAQQSDDGPPAKKQKTEADLIPEAVFLQSCTSPSVTVRVSVPVDYSKPEWNLKGQTLKITLPYKDFVSVIKEKVFEQIALPAGKQKLVFDGMFIKDSNTLAFYNVPNDALVGLQLKERGGRKK